MKHQAAASQSLAVDVLTVPGALRGALAILGATVVMALGFGALGLTSVFMAPLESQFGWSRADTSLVYGLATVGMAVGGMFWGRLFDRLDLRVLLAIGGAGMALSLLSMSVVQALWQIYLANIVLAGLGFSVLYAPLLAVSGEWFSSRRGLVTGTSWVQFTSY
ncbi:MAG: MFS transporter [Dichotomicrobium sp.]